MPWRLWGSVVAVDLGTANLRIWDRSNGAVVREASAVAYRAGRERALAVGRQARELAQHPTDELRIVEPIRRSAVAEFRPAVALLRSLVGRAVQRRSLLSPAAVVSTAAQCTGVERRALVEAVRAAGFSRVYPVAKSLAAGAGAGLPITGEESLLVIDLGAGVTEIAVVAMGMATVVRSVPVGGIDLDEAVRKYLWRQAGIQVSRAAAEDVKLHVGAVDPALCSNSLDLSALGPPTMETKISAADLATVLADALEPVLDEAAWTLEQLAPRQRSEIAARGGVLTGGGALLKGLPELLSRRLGIPMSVAEDPLGATLLGLGAIAAELRPMPPDAERLVHLSLPTHTHRY
jgi:rod shape-determining protein MreB